MFYLHEHKQKRQRNIPSRTETSYISYYFPPITAVVLQLTLKASIVTPASSGAICFNRYEYISESATSCWKLVQRRVMPALCSWWLTQRRRIASGDRASRSSILSWNGTFFYLFVRKREKMCCNNQNCCVKFA